MEQNRFDAIRVRVTEVLEKARLRYGVALNPTISFNLTGRVAGWAGCKTCAGQQVYWLKFNSDLIRGEHFNDILNNTISHEIAHLVCFARPELGKNHNRGWKRVCIALGGNGNRTHDFAVTYAHGSWDYISDTGSTLTVSQIRHTKIQKGAEYRFKHGKGTINRWCRFAETGRAMPATPPNGAKPAVGTAQPVLSDGWNYITTTGHEINVTKHMHTKIQNGSVYRVSNNRGKLDRYCRFARAGQPIPATPPNGRVIAEFTWNNIGGRNAA